MATPEASPVGQFRATHKTRCTQSAVHDHRALDEQLTQRGSVIFMLAEFIVSAFGVCDFVYRYRLLCLGSSES